MQEKSWHNLKIALEACGSQKWEPKSPMLPKHCADFLLLLPFPNTFCKINF